MGPNVALLFEAWQWSCKSVVGVNACALPWRRKANLRMAEESETTKKEPIAIHYEKGPNYSNIYADGSVVAPNGRGMVTISFYNQRFTIPKLAHLVQGPEDGTGVEEDIESKEGLFRQIEGSVFLDVAAAKDLVRWLQNAIDFSERNPLSSVDIEEDES